MPPVHHPRGLDVFGRRADRPRLAGRSSDKHLRELGCPVPPAVVGRTRVLQPYRKEGSLRDRVLSGCGPWPAKRSGRPYRRSPQRRHDHQSERVLPRRRIGCLLSGPKRSKREELVRRCHRSSDRQAPTGECRLDSRDCACRRCGSRGESWTDAPRGHGVRAGVGGLRRDACRGVHIDRRRSRPTRRDA